MATKYIGVLDLATPADTNWHDIASDDMYDATDGAAVPSKLAAGMVLEDVAFVNTSANAGLLCLGAAAAAPAAATNKIPLPSNTTTAWTGLREVRSRFRLTTFAYKKGAAGDTITCVATWWAE